MKLLFLHLNRPDYLAESLFHGLRKVLGNNCVDVPRYDSMYAPLTDSMKSKLRGNGFTLYGLLKEDRDLADKRFYWEQDLEQYDLIVLANIWEQWNLVCKLLSNVTHKKLVVLDGMDIAAVFPFSSFSWRIKNYPWSYFTCLSQLKYFKRELIGEGCSYQLERLLARPFRKWISLPKNAVPIAFSIPAEKIWRADHNRQSKNFTTHIVDDEIAAEVEAFFSQIGSNKYVFSTEAEYYDDLRRSRFGITTKRGGWESLRNYELAANGCVLCFKDLDLKPETCAPHGLNESNSITYHNYVDLMDRIHSLTTDEYKKLKTATYEWIEKNTTIARAKEFIAACQT
jgi:hypothetical protein